MVTYACMYVCMLGGNQHLMLMYSRHCHFVQLQFNRNAILDIHIHLCRLVYFIIILLLFFFVLFATILWFYFHFYFNNLIFCLHYILFLLFPSRIIVLCFSLYSCLCVGVRKNFYITFDTIAAAIRLKVSNNKNCNKLTGICLWLFTLVP